MSWYPYPEYYFPPLQSHSYPQYSGYPSYHASETSAHIYNTREYTYSMYHYNSIVQPINHSVQSQTLNICDNSVHPTYSLPHATHPLNEHTPQESMSTPSSHYNFYDSSTSAIYPRSNQISNDPKYTCYECYMNYETKLELRAHLKGHCKPYCPMCLRCFPGNTDLIDHVKEVHPEYLLLIEQIHPLIAADYVDHQHPEDRDRSISELNFIEVCHQPSETSQNVPEQVSPVIEVECNDIKTSEKVAVQEVVREADKAIKKKVELPRLRSKSQKTRGRPTRKCPLSLQGNEIVHKTVVSRAGRSILVRLPSY